MYSDLLGWYIPSSSLMVHSYRVISYVHGLFLLPAHSNPLHIAVVGYNLIPPV